MPRPDCPDCGSPLPYRGDACKACGWSRVRTAVVDPDAMRCEWVADERCCYAGTMSPGTLGGGPWYCRGHFGCDDPAHGQRIVTESVRAMRGVSLSGPSLRQAARTAFLARPLPPVPATPPGVRIPPGSVGMFRRSAEIAMRHSPKAEAEAEREAIQNERSAAAPRGTFDIV